MLFSFLTKLRDAAGFPHRKNSVSEKSKEASVSEQTDAEKRARPVTLESESNENSLGLKTSEDQSRVCSSSLEVFSRTLPYTRIYAAKSRYSSTSIVKSLSFGNLFEYSTEGSGESLKKEKQERCVSSCSPAVLARRDQKSESGLLERRSLFETKECIADVNDNSEIGARKEFKIFKFHNPQTAKESLKKTGSFKMFSMFKKSNAKNVVQDDTALTSKQTKNVSSFLNWSPSSARRNVTAPNTSITRQIYEPNPNPVHFNRPSPTTSPLPLRRSRTQEQVNKPRDDEVAPWRSPLSRRKINKNVSKTVPAESINISNIEKNNFNIKNIPQKDNEQVKSAKTSEKQTEGQSYKMATEQHYNEQNGHLAKTESIASVTHSGGQSYSKSVERSFVVSSQSTKMEVVKDNTNINVSEKTASEEKASGTIVHSPTPWRKARATEAAAKDDATASAPPWRKEKELLSISSESKEVSSTNTQTVTTHLIETNVQQSQLVQSSSTIVQQSAQHTAQLNQQNQQERTFIQQQEQQQQHQQKHQQQTFIKKQTQFSTNQQEVPWRSPQLKKKEFSNTQSPAFLNIKSSTGTLLGHQKNSSTGSTGITNIDKGFVKESEKGVSASDNLKDPISNFVKSDSDNNKESLKLSDNFAHPLPSQLPPLPVLSPLNKDIAVSSQTLPSVSSATLNINMPSSTENSELSKENKQEDVESLQSTKPSEEQNLEGVKPEATETLESEAVEQQEPQTSESVESPPPPPSLPTENQDVLASNVDHSPLPPPPPPPPPPSANIEGPQTCPPQFPTVIPDPLPLEPSSPEYQPEPVISLIQQFEKQASSDGEKKEKEVPQAKPVAPWVKRTSSGPVHQEGWDLSPIEGIPVVDEPFVKVEKKIQKQIFPDPSVSSIKMVLSQPPKDEAPAVPKPLAPFSPEQLMLQHKQLQVLKFRPRTRSTGDYSHSYVDHDVLKMDPDSFSSVTHGGKHGISPLAKQHDEPSDPACDPQHPKAITFQDISAASFKIKSGIMNTPCTYSTISNLVGMEVYFKKEFNQITGSFKERGARYTLLCLPDGQKTKGVIAASAGNHALALSYHGQDLGIPVTVVMPLVAPIMKVQACRQYGANVLVRGADIGEGREIALKMAKEQGLTYINGYDHPDILAGQGTMGLEIVEQVSNIDAVIVPVGGGGLIAGVALAVKSLYPHIKVIGVESERCPSFNAAMKSKKPVYVKAESSLADGLNVPMTGVNAFATASKLVDKTVVVKEEWIAIAILRLVEIEKAVVEGAGATALAALLADDLPEFKGKRVVIPLCGGNIDTTVLGRCLERGLAADGRLVKFTVRVSDRPGGIADLTRLLANLGVSIKDMLHERAWIRSDIFSVEVKVLCETRDHEHSEELKDALFQRYRSLQFSDL